MGPTATWRIAMLPAGLLFAVTGERLLLHDPSAARGARPARPGRGASAAAVALLGASGVGNVHARLDGVHTEIFRKVDLDDDRKLSQVEYLGYVRAGSGGEDISELKHVSIFAQADIDDDGWLSQDEFLFARHIAGEAAEQEFLEQMADKMPHNYVQRIDNMFSDLRAATKGVLSFDEYIMAMGHFLGLRASASKLDEDSRETLSGLFEVADVIEDNFINNNELDFLQYLVRDAFVDAALEADVLTKEQVDRPILDQFVEMLDADGDGKLILSEVLGILPELLVPSPEHGDLYRTHMEKLFGAADTDGDRMLDPDEAARFLSLML